MDVECVGQSSLGLQNSSGAHELGKDSGVPGAPQGGSGELLP